MCSICIEDWPIPSGLRILTPCGHGFCADCVGKLSAPGNQIVCPTCRMLSTSVVTPFF
jgi:hypothetical protein